MLAPGAVLRAVVVVIVGGARSLAELEAMTASMSAVARRCFGLARRLPDTTVRGLLVRLAPDELRLLLRAELAGFLDCKHLRTIVHIHREVLSKDGAVQQRGDRYFVSSLAPDSLDAPGWARLLRARWGVENNTHHTLDAVLEEDERPWFQEDPVGSLNVIILRRLAYNAMTLYRARTLRAEGNRLMPWRTLMQWVAIALITATEATVKDLRVRAPP